MSDTKGLPTIASSLPPISGYRAVVAFCPGTDMFYLPGIVDPIKLEPGVAYIYATIQASETDHWERPYLESVEDPDDRISKLLLEVVDIYTINNNVKQPTSSRMTIMSYIEENSFYIRQAMVQKDDAHRNDMLKYLQNRPYSFSPTK